MFKEEAEKIKEEIEHGRFKSYNDERNMVYDYISFLSNIREACDKVRRNSFAHDFASDVDDDASDAWTILEPLEELQRLLGGTIRKQLGIPVGNRHLRHSWQMSCQQAREALIKMMPYFRNKQEVATLGIELQNTMGNRGEGTTEALQLLRAMLKQKISTLNAKD